MTSALRVWLERQRSGLGVLISVFRRPVDRKDTHRIVV